MSRTPHPILKGTKGQKQETKGCGLRTAVAPALLLVFLSHRSCPVGFLFAYEFLRILKCFVTIENLVVATAAWICPAKSENFSI